jgi:26S proteasome regulatory subunit N10
MSMQEEQARQAAQDEAQRAQDQATSSSNPEPTVTPATAAPTNEKPGGKDVEMNTGAEAGPDEDEEMDEDEAIARAIEMSMKGQEEKHE